VAEFYVTLATLYVTVCARGLCLQNVAAKIVDGDVVLVYGRSTGVEAGLLRAHQVSAPRRPAAVPTLPPQCQLLNSSPPFTGFFC
jgi:hypothetical protein